MKAGMLLLALALVVLTPAVVIAQDDKAPMSEQQFIELAGAAKEGDASSGETGQPHKVAGEGAETTAEETEDPESPEPEDPEESSGSGEEGEGSESGEDEDPEDPEDDDAEEPGSRPEEGEGEDTETRAERKAREKAEQDAFEKALAAEGGSTSLEDIPEAARPIVAKKIRDLERGFTRITQRLSEEQKSATQFKAEERFRGEHPVDFIIEMIRSKPELAEAYNKRIEELEGNATAAEGHKALVEKARADAAKAEEGEIEKGKATQARVENYVKLGRAAARAAGVPFDLGVEQEIAAHLLASDDGTITEQEIRAIAKRNAVAYQRQLRQVNRDKSGQYVKDKVADKKGAGLKVRPGAGSPPAPGRKAMPKNDQEFIEQFSARS